MTRTLPEWAFLVDETGRHWYHLGSGTCQAGEGEDGSRPPGKSLFAIATNDLVSIPQWVNSKDPATITEMVSTEISRHGFQQATGPGKVVDWKPVEQIDNRTLVQSITSPWSLEELTKRQPNSDFVSFFPQYALYAPPENAAVLWREGKRWVAGYSRGSRWLHVQTLGGEEMRPLLAGEVNLTLIELNARALLEGVTRIVVWATYDPELHHALGEETGLSVVFETRPGPDPASAPLWDFEPHEIALARIARTRRRRGLAAAFLALLALSMLAAAATFHLWHLRESNARLMARVEENRGDAATISSAMDRWHTLGPAIDPLRSPIELFHQISLLLPETGLRLTSFEVRDDKVIEVRAEGATMANAIQIKAAFEKAEALADYTWEIPPPRAKDDLTEIFATGTYRF